MAEVRAAAPAVTSGPPWQRQFVPLQQTGRGLWELHKPCWVQLRSQFGPQIQLLKRFHNVCKRDSENRTSVLPDRGDRSSRAVYTGGKHSLPLHRCLSLSSSGAQAVATGLCGGVKG